MAYRLFELGCLFFVYSFLGWILETSVLVIKKRKLINRGILTGPICAIYGVSAVVMTVGLAELRDNLIFLFLGCAVYATIIEWITGGLLEKVLHTKWWDYSEKKWNLGGYVCLQYSVLWGILGVVGIRYANPIILLGYRFIPYSIRTISMWILLGIFAIDILGSVIAIFHMKISIPPVDEVNTRLAKVRRRLALWITGHIERRMEKAYPNIRPERVETREKPEVFAKGCGFYKLFILFVVGAFLGDIVETVFCRYSMGRWMSRSSFVWGPFSIVWGMAIVLATLLLNNFRDRSDGFLFIFGTVVGGAYEYLCSVLTEIVFGKIFWDYSKLPFNLGGRINLLFCFFWGIAAVLWMKKLYPRISDLIERVPVKPGKIVTWIMIVFITADMVVSGLALIRYEARELGQPTQYVWDTWLDENFDDETMERIYPSAKPAGKAKEKLAEMEQGL